MIDALPTGDGVDDDVWRELYAKVHAFVARRVRQDDVDDVVQDVFLRIHRSLPALRDDQRFGPWIYQIARSAIVDHARVATRHPQPVGDQPEPTYEPHDGDDDAVEREVALYAALFVLMLPSPYREALILTELQGLTQKEAAQTLGVSLPAMKSRVRRGREKLRTALEDCCQITLDARHRVVECEPRADGKLPNNCCAGEENRA